MTTTATAIVTIMAIAISRDAIHGMGHADHGNGLENMSLVKTGR
jgi:hypothetical protein